MRTVLLLFLVILVTNCHPYLRKLGLVTRKDCEKQGKGYEVTFQSTCTISGKTENSSSEEDCVDDGGTFTPETGKCVDKTSNSGNNSFNFFISFKFSLVFITYLLF